MNYDIRTPDLAYETFHELMSYEKGEFIEKVVLECNNDFDVFIEENMDYIKALDISKLRFVGFHVTTSSDFCADIRKNGIRSLRKVLSERNGFSKLLFKYGVEFDVDKNLMIYNGKSYDVNYSNYSNSSDNPLKSIARKLCFDPQVNGFFSCSDVKKYGTEIHERPEFFIQLVSFDNKLRKAEEDWKNISKGYIINFTVKLEQFAWYTFYSNENEYNDDQEDLTNLKIKLIAMAYNRMNDNIDGRSQIIFYLNEESHIEPKQIISYEEI